jgi:hypothetical protein
MLMLMLRMRRIVLNIIILMMICLSVSLLICTYCRVQDRTHPGGTSLPPSGTRSHHTSIIIIIGGGGGTEQQQLQGTLPHRDGCRKFTLVEQLGPHDGYIIISIIQYGQPHGDDDECELS